MALASRTWRGLQNINRSVFYVTQPPKLFRNGRNNPKVSFHYSIDAVGVTSSGGGSRSRTEVDPARYFFHEEVQSCLLQMNMRDTSKVFKPRRESQNLETVELKFLTQEELEKAQATAMETARYYLQPPPVIGEKKEELQILSKDPALQGFEESKILVTDVSSNVPHRERIIVVRDPDGTLRHASREERHRMLQVYFPKEGRSYEVPSVFSSTNLKSLWERSEFVFVLDLACTQFEPDDPDYIRVTSGTYEYIDSTGMYETVIGTRHYGAMAFYLAFSRKLDSFLKFCISTYRIEDAVASVRVYYVTRPEIKDVAQPASPDDIEFLKEYITKHSKDKVTLNATLNAYLESHVPTETLEASLSKQ